MSTIYDKTDNYSLNLYGDNDPADLRDGYNGSMRTIDTTLETHLNRIEGVESRETHDEEVTKALLGDNTVDSATAAKTKWDKAAADATYATGKADSNTSRLNLLESKTQRLEAARQRNIVLLGDSWTVVHNNALYNRLQADLPNVIWHNYGINGAVLQRLPEMIDKAKADGSLNADMVTEVIIVMGTNNVFWERLDGYETITRESAYNAFKAVRDYFINANILFFPNNSKTLNQGRNELYAFMIEGAQRAGVATVLESLTLLCGHLEWFNGDDQEGVQHLSDDGYRIFADRIVGVLQGASMGEQGLIGPPHGYQYTDAQNMSQVDDNTLQIYYRKTDNTDNPVTQVGWLSSPVAIFHYHSDQSVDITIKGVLHLNDIQDVPTDNGIWGISCPNWSKAISKNTLPYAFMSTDLNNGYYLPKEATGFSKDWIYTIFGAHSESWVKDVFYIEIPPLTAEDSNKFVNFKLRQLFSTVTGAGR